jgi:hypothetical protein
MRQLNKAIWPHCITVGQGDNYAAITRAEKWATQKLGKKTHRWTMVQGYESTRFYFKEGRDATLFSLSCL